MALRSFGRLKLLNNIEQDSKGYEHLTAVCQRAYHPGKLWNPRGIAINKNTNEIYIVEAGVDFSRISIFSEAGQLIDMFINKAMNWPYGIAIHEENMYVTDTALHAIFKYKLMPHIHFIVRVGKFGCGSEEFNDPKQLAVSTKGEVFVADRDNHRIKILDNLLEYEREITDKSMTSPCDVKLTPHEVYVLSSKDSNCVHVFTHNGVKIRSLISRGYGMQVREARFFHLDHNRDIIISDFEAHHIEIFSKEGYHISTVGEYGHGAGMLEYPLGVTLTNNKKLVIVSCNHMCALQIFSTSIYDINIL